VQPAKKKGQAYNLSSDSEDDEVSSGKKVRKQASPPCPPGPPVRLPFR
jgi:hypothetical protein